MNLRKDLCGFCFTLIVTVVLAGCGGGSSSGGGEDHMEKFVTRNSGDDFQAWQCRGRNGVVSILVQLFLTDSGKGLAYFGAYNSDEDETIEFPGEITDWDATSKKLTVEYDIDNSSENTVIIFDNYEFSGVNEWSGDFRYEALPSWDGLFTPECRLVDQDGNLV